MSFLARKYYGDRYDDHLGIVRLPQAQVLRETFKEIPPGRQTNPHIQFFQQMNPGYLQGDELVCFTELSANNLTRAGQRMWFANENLVVESGVQK
jgi:hypothetical protein